MSRHSAHYLTDGHRSVESADRLRAYLWLEYTAKVGQRVGDRACKGGVVAAQGYEWMASEQQLVPRACPCATQAHPYTISQMGGKPEEDPNATLATHQPLFNRDTFPHFRIKARVAGGRVGGACIPAPCSRGQISTNSPPHLNLGLPGCPARQLLRLRALPLRLCRVLRQVPPAMCVGLRDAGCERDGASERALVCGTGSAHSLKAISSTQNHPPPFVCRHPHWRDERHDHPSPQDKWRSFRWDA